MGTMDDKTLRQLRGWHSNGTFNVAMLAEWLEKRGHDILGTGAYGTVIDCDLFVVKVLDADDAGYLNWINFCQLAAPSVYLPEIYYSQRISKHLHIVVLEKLELRENVEFNETYKGIKAYGSQSCWVGRDNKRCAENLSPNLKALLELMMEYARGYNQAIDEHNQKCAVTGGNYKWMITKDIHSGNVMFRGNQLVITDPWCV